MIHVTEHIPGYVERTPGEFEVADVAELLTLPALQRWQSLPKFVGWKYVPPPGLTPEGAARYELQGVPVGTGGSVFAVFEGQRQHCAVQLRFASWHAAFAFHEEFIKATG